MARRKAVQQKIIFPLAKFNELFKAGDYNGIADLLLKQKEFKFDTWQWPHACDFFIRALSFLLIVEPNTRGPAAAIIATESTKLFERLSTFTSFGTQYLKLPISFTSGEPLENCLNMITDLHPDFDVDAWLEYIADHFFVLLQNIRKNRTYLGDEYFVNDFCLKTAALTLFFVKAEINIQSHEFIHTKRILDKCVTLDFLLNKPKHQHIFQLQQMLIDAFTPFGNVNIALFNHASTELLKTVELEAEDDHRFIQAKYTTTIEFMKLFEPSFVATIHNPNGAFYSAFVLEIIEKLGVVMARRTSSKLFCENCNKPVGIHVLATFTHRLYIAAKNGNYLTPSFVDPDYNVRAWLRDITDNFVVLMGNIISSYSDDDEALQLYTQSTHALMFYMKVEQMIPEDDLTETMHFLEQCKNLKCFAKEKYQCCFQFLISFVDIFVGTIDSAEVERVLVNLSMFERMFDRILVQDIIITVANTVNLFDQKFDDSLSAQNAPIYFAFLGGLAEKLPAITSLSINQAVNKKTFCGCCENAVGAHALYDLAATACFLYESCYFKEICEEAIAENFNKVFQLGLQYEKEHLIQIADIERSMADIDLYD